MIILGREESVYNCTLPFLPFLLFTVRFKFYFKYSIQQQQSIENIRYPFTHSAGIFKQSRGARNRIGIGCRTGRLHRLEELIPWNRFLDSLKIRTQDFLTYNSRPFKMEQIFCLKRGHF